VRGAAGGLAQAGKEACDEESACEGQRGGASARLATWRHAIAPPDRCAHGSVVAQAAKLAGRLLNRPSSAAVGRPRTHTAPFQRAPLMASVLMAGIPQRAEAGARAGARAYVDELAASFILIGLEYSYRRYW
jgi:hypothetical protein